MKLLFKNSKTLFNFIHKKIKKKNFIISGGNTIKKILRNMNYEKNFFDSKILLSDERLVKRGSNLRNDVFFYNLIKKKLINKKNFYNFKGQFINKVEAKMLERQTSKLNLEIAILALGSNGHIASIFKIDKQNKSNFYFIENSPKYPKKRFTISIKKISKCKKIYLVASSSHRKKEIMQLKKNFLIKNIKKKIQLLLIP